ncbi:RNF213 isoform 13, partial [Pan troglodytes]
LSSQRGMEFVQGLSKPGRPHQWVFPKDVVKQQGLQQDHPGQMDRYLVYGDEYKALRDAVAKAVLECKPLGIKTALKVGWARGFSLIPGGIPWSLRVRWFMSNDAG